MQAIQKINPLVRAVLVVGAIAGLVTSVTFAALSGTATLSASTLSTTSTNLLLWDGDSFEDTAPGFDVDNLIPGEGSGELPFYFQNTSGVDLDLTVHMPEAPALSTGLTPADVKATFTSNAPGCAENTATYTFAQLLDETPDALPCNPLNAGATGNSGVPATEGNYTVNFDIDPEAIEGEQANVGAFDLVFTGTQATEEVPEVPAP